MADESQAEETPIPLALYPVYLYNHGEELPQEGKYYVLAQNGVFFKKDTKVGSALLKVDGVPWLKSLSQSISLKLPKVPGLIIAQALTFFRKVFDKHQSEAYVTLLYSDKLNQYRLWCPTQTVTRGSVNYDRTDQPEFAEREGEGWQMVGTIHSHCDFSAFHSGTDTHDESTFDGVHITLGHVNRNQFSMCSSVALNNHRETLEPENCALGVVRVSNQPVVRNKWMTWGDANYFELALSDEEAQQLVRDTELIENEWMPKVTHGYKEGRRNGGTFRGLGFFGGTY